MLDRLEAEREDLEFVSIHELFARHGPRQPPVRTLTAEEEAAVDWAMLVRRQPRLADLHAVCETLRASGKSWAWRRGAWYAVFKPALETMVGWYVESTDAVLRSTRAWDVAYHHCYDALTGEGDD